MTVEEFRGILRAASKEKNRKWAWVMRFDAMKDTLTLRFKRPVTEAFAAYAMRCILFADRTDQYYHARPPSKLDDGKTWVFYHQDEEK